MLHPGAGCTQAEAKQSPSSGDARCCCKQHPSFPPAWRELWNRFFSNPLAWRQGGGKAEKGASRDLAPPARAALCATRRGAPRARATLVGSRAGWVLEGAVWATNLGQKPPGGSCRGKRGFVCSQGWDPNLHTGSSQGSGTEMPKAAEQGGQGCKATSHLAWVSSEIPPPSCKPGSQIGSPSPFLGQGLLGAGEQMCRQLCSTCIPV